MKIIIVGYGYVGKAVFNAIKDKNEVVIVDPQYTTNEIKYHHDADGIIICVPTPATPNGGCDSSIIAQVLDEVPVFLPVLIKSTVTPAVVDALDKIYSNHSICYSPEFLRAKTANADFLNQKHIIIGGEDPECFWQDLFQESLPNCGLVFNCSAHEACLIKYASNSFLALKTSFFNQLFDLCNETGMSFDVVRQLLTHDHRIGSDHTMVPGPDGNRGWGGHCFPKDTQAFTQWATAIGVPATLVESAIEYNKKIRKNY